MAVVTFVSHDGKKHEAGWSSPLQHACARCSLLSSSFRVNDDITHIDRTWLRHVHEYYDEQSLKITRNRNRLHLIEIVLFEFS